MTSIPTEQQRKDVSLPHTINGAAPAKATPDGASAWQAISGQWLRAAEARTEESAAYARRQDALRRWRGLLPEVEARP